MRLGPVIKLVCYFGRLKEVVVQYRLCLSSRTLSNVEWGRDLLSFAPTTNPSFRPEAQPQWRNLRVKASSISNLTVKTDGNPYLSSKFGIAFKQVLRLRCASLRMTDCYLFMRLKRSNLTTRPGDVTEKNGKGSHIYLHRRPVASHFPGHAI